MEEYLETATANQTRARQIIDRLRITESWQAIGAEINLVGSLRMGLLAKHRDIDFHIYSSAVDPHQDFMVMAELAARPGIVRIEYANLLHTDEACVEWHAWYRDQTGEEWQIDMIHIVRGSAYDGFFEKMADRISAVLTEESRNTILKLKYDTPDECKIAGIEYYRAVIQAGVRTYDEFCEWRRRNPLTGIDTWMP